jgi:hypothetical protein
MNSYRQTQADNTISAVTTTEVQSDYPTTKKTLIHVYNTPGHRTYCGRKFLKLVPGVNLASASDLFGPKPLLSHEVLCEKCEATDEYQERYALYLLAEAGV